MTPQIPRASSGYLAVPLDQTAVGSAPSLADNSRKQAILLSVIVIGQACFLAASLATGGSSGVEQKSALSVFVSRGAWLALTASGLAAIGLVSRSSGTKLGRAVRNSFLALIATQLLSSAFAGQPMPINTWIPPVIVIVVLERFPISNLRYLLRLAFTATIIPVAASVGALFIGAKWAILDEPRRLPFPFSTGRLIGVLPDPNALGPLAAVALLMCFAYRPRWTLLWVAMCTIAIWGAESRTSIAVLPVALSVIFLERRRPPPLLRNAWLFIGAGSSILALYLQGIIQSILGSQDAITLNGRTRVWSYAANYWWSSPFVGVGPRAFDLNFREQSGLTFAGQGHNQVMQTLASEGLIGVVVLTIFVVVFARLCAQKSTLTDGASLAAGLIVLTTMITEAPLRATRWSPSLFLMTVVLILGYAQRTRPSPDIAKYGLASEVKP